MQPEMTTERLSINTVLPSGVLSGTVFGEIKWRWLHAEICDFLSQSKVNLDILDQNWSCATCCDKIESYH